MIKCSASLRLANQKTASETLALPQNRAFLNLVSVRGEFVAEHAGKIDIVQDDHVGVVFFAIVVLPAFVPPAEADDRRPPI
jgi:hypothetical protein